MYEKIAGILKERELTFADLSRGTGIRESVFSNLKYRDGGELSVANVRKIAAFLAVTTDAIIT